VPATPLSIGVLLLLIFSPFSPPISYQINLVAKTYTLCYRSAVAAFSVHRL
jgi:hypothetical protein